MIQAYKIAMICVVIASGTASQYARGVMEDNIRIRQAGRTAHDLPMDITDVDGFIAARECARIGEIWDVVGPLGIERFMVADCSGHKSTTSWMLRDSILFEIDYNTAVRWATVGRGAPVSIVSCSDRKVYEYD
jgi:hypothetical protein